MPDFIQNHPIIGNERKRTILAVIFLLLALAFAVLAGVTQYGLIKVLLIIFCVPALFLTIVDVVMREGED